MKLTATIVTALFGASAFALADPTRKKISFEIKDFTELKPDGHATKDVQFNIVPTAGGSSAQCKSYNQGGTGPVEFYAETVFSCGESSPFWWSYKFGDTVSGASAKLKLWYSMSAENYFGEVNFAELAGGDCNKSSPKGKGAVTVCKQPASPKVVIELTLNVVEPQQ